MSENFDLFGHAVREGFGKRGRPPFEPTEKDRNKVKLLLALGWSTARIGNALNVSGKTIQRYFSPELKSRDGMRDALDARRFELAMQQACEGNMTALRLLGDLIDRNDRMDFERSVGSTGQEAGIASKPGKKAIDQERAAQADAELMAELDGEAQYQHLNS